MAPKINTLDDLINYVSELNLKKVDQQIQQMNQLANLNNLNGDNHMLNDNMDSEEISEDQKIINIINNSVQDISDLPSCIYFTNSFSPNDAKNYPFANKVSIHVCSNKEIFPNQTQVNPCISTLSQKHCSGYTMDYQVVSKYNSSNQIYCLVRYRKITGSIAYLIIDLSGSVYQAISHEPSLSIADNNLDDDAESLFYSFVTQIASEDSINFEKPVIEEVKNKKTSYLSYVLG